MAPRLLPLIIVFYDMCTSAVTDLYLPSLPAITDQFGASELAGQFTLTLFMAGFAAAHLIFGPLADAYGRKPVMVIGALAFITSVVAAAVAPSIETLNAARLLQGVTLASFAVTAQAMVRELYDDAQVIKVLSFIAMVEGLAPALAPVIGAEIALAAGWRATFWIVAICAGASLILLIRMAPESLPRERRVPLRVGTIAVTYLRLLMRRDFMAPLLAAGLIFAGLMLYLTAAPFFVVETAGGNERTYAIIQLINVLFYILGLLITSRLADKVAANTLIIAGYVAAAGGGISMAVWAALAPLSLYTLAVCFSAYALGIGLSMAPLITRALSANRDATGAVAAVMGLVVVGCAFLGSLASGLAYDGTSLSIALPLAGAALLAIGVFALAGPARQPAQPPVQDTAAAE